MDNLHATKVNMIKKFRFVLADQYTYYQGGVLDTDFEESYQEVEFEKKTV